MVRETLNAAMRNLSNLLHIDEIQARPAMGKRKILIFIKYICSYSLMI